MLNIRVYLQDRLNSFRMILLSFVLLILAGALLLCLPWACADGEHVSFLNALFTSTSAACVTGLVVFDTATKWTLFGKIVILVLIQIGGLGVITATMARVSLTGIQIGLRPRLAIQDAVSAPQIGGVVRFMRFLVAGTFLIEGIGAVCLFPAFYGQFGLVRGLGYAVFHSISAFCNAGFDLMGVREPFSSLTSLSASIPVNMTIMLLIIVGGAGFLTWDDLLTNRFRFQRLRLQTKIILASTAVLILAPFLYFYLVEFRTVPGRERFLLSLFQSVTPRTAGFNTFDYGRMSERGWLITIILMMVGGAPGSTAGGMKVTTMATTHYSELKAFALGTPGVENASVEFNVETLRPTYRLSIGVPGKSNAFEISRKLGLPEFLIEDANSRLSQDAVRFEDVIANAEYHRQIAEKERELAEEAHRETQRLRDEAEKLQKELADRRESELRKAKDEARKLLQKAQRESEQIIADLKKQRSAGVKEHELHNLRAQLQGAIDANTERISADETVGTVPTSLKVGDTVLLVNLNTKATVVTPPDSKGECTVQAGALKLKANLADMRTAKPDKPEKPKGRQPAKGNGGGTTINVGVRQVQTECDVRGMNLEEAIDEVDAFLDGALLNKLGQVYIIHGKGTGILRNGIQQHLKRYGAVKSFRLGKYGEGEDGVTVVTLK
ncbi:MAG: Smr/MutS family protein [Clostridia bacterium]|nr:Smr/MutS family protein [Clostridia bacterium]